MLIGHVYIFLFKVFKSLAYLLQLYCLIFIIDFYQILIHSEHKSFVMFMNCEHSLLFCGCIIIFLIISFEERKLHKFFKIFME